MRVPSWYLTDEPERSADMSCVSPSWRRVWDRRVACLDSRHFDPKWRL